MKTEIADEKALAYAGEIIRSGGLVAFPTETVYGLGANAFDENAVASVFEAKGRPGDNPLIVHVSKVEDAEPLCYLTEEAKRLFAIFTPGPLTIIMKKKSVIPDCVTAGLDSVGIRIPGHKLARDFIAAAGVPIAAPSANTSTKVSPTTAQAVLEDMDGKIPLILDGGQCAVGIESTVLSLAGEVPEVLRPGAVTVEDLLAYLPRVRNHKGELKVSPSPGMKYKHYAPTCDCVMASSEESAKKRYDEETAAGRRAVILGNSAYHVGDRNFYDLGATPGDVAKNIFKALRDCEKNNDLIIVEEFSEEKLEFSIMNRLKKSTQGVLI